MKFLSVILSLYIVTLSLSFCLNSCLVENEKCQIEQQDCADCCSPFSLCNTCAGFVIEKRTDIETKTQAVSTDVDLDQIQIYTNAYLDSIWQPPQFA